MGERYKINTLDIFWIDKGYVLQMNFQLIVNKWIIKNPFIKNRGIGFIY
jgi:hypothetical protein